MKIKVLKDEMKKQKKKEKKKQTLNNKNLEVLR